MKNTQIGSRTDKDTTPIEVPKKPAVDVVYLVGELLPEYANLVDLYGGREGGIRGLHDYYARMLGSDTVRRLMQTGETIDSIAFIVDPKGLLWTLAPSLRDGTRYGIVICPSENQAERNLTRGDTPAVAEGMRSAYQSFSHIVDGQPKAVVHPRHVDPFVHAASLIGTPHNLMGEAVTQIEYGKVMGIPQQPVNRRT